MEPTSRGVLCVRLFPVAALPRVPPQDTHDTGLFAWWRPSFLFPFQDSLPAVSKDRENLGGSLTSQSSWNEEDCMHTGQEQVAACGLDSKAEEKAACLSPGGTLVAWGEANPCHGSRELPE